jgi:uncharacterized protein involved in exopolysaccharide biosynthesis
MNSGKNLDHAPSFSLVDIYFVVFRRKWLILFFTAIGVIAGLGYFFTHKPPYQSSVKLMIKYVMTSGPENVGESGAHITSMDQAQSVMNSELQILTSFNLYQQVATNLGSAILSKITESGDAVQAASIISGGLKVEPLRDSSVIQITFRHPDATVVAPVVGAIYDEYLNLHMKFHNSIGISDALLTEKSSQLKSQIAITDAELHMVKTNAGIVDVKEAAKTYSEEIANIRHELFTARRDLVEHQAGMSEITSSKKNEGRQTNAFPLQKISDDVLNKYKSTCSRLIYLQKKLSDYLLVQGYTDENRLVKESRDQLAELEKIKSQLEEKSPELANLDVATISQRGSANDVGASSSVQISLLPTRIKTLESQLAQIQSEANALGDTEQKIDELMRKKKVQESYLNTIETTLERTRISEDMGPGRQNNINSIQTPTPPFRDYQSYYKKISTMLFGGFGFGLALAFLLEMVLDRSIKRPIEVQTKLKIPFFLSIPDLNVGSRKSGNKMLSAPERKQLGYTPTASSNSGAVVVKESELEVMSWEVNRRFDSYYDALRDRLVVYFESINLTRKPKLVAVTSTHKGAGVSTIAAGLASSLSETGDGRVLLVDMNLENGAAQQFFKGKPNCKLDDALESDTRDGARVQDNLYVVTEDTVTDRLPRALPKRFASLIPKLKASDYDYIIFDMPPVSPTSVTARLSGFMDTVMLVIESEKTDVQVVQQANALLAQSKANVTAVLNKTKTYIPKQLHQDFLSDV